MKAYLIPGWGESLTDRNYKAILELYKTAGYDPEFVVVDWNNKLIGDWVAEVESKISKLDLNNSLLSGFSFGAMISLFLAAEYAKPRKLFLYSLSPYFAEDILKLKKSWIDGIGKRKVEDFKQLNFSDLASKVDSSTYLFVGGKEGIESEYRANDAHKMIKGSQLATIDGVGHDVTEPRYIQAIRQYLTL